MAIFGMLFEQQQKKTVIGVKDDQDSLDKGKGLFPETTGGIGGIVVDATVSEDHSHTCEVTENPVEEGVKITDHVQMNPSQLTINGVISDTPLGFAFIGSIPGVASDISGGLNNPNSISGNFPGNQGPLSIQAFNKMLDLQRKKQPFTVITGLKRYKNMIMTDLKVQRTPQTANAIHFTSTFKEIRIVKSQSVTGKPSAGAKNTAGSTKDKGSHSSESKGDATSSDNSAFYDMVHGAPKK